MSASSKKKLRKEQMAAELTEKQQKERVESKKLKTYSIIFIVLILAVVIAAAAIFGTTTAKRLGLVEKATTAAVVDGEKLNSIEMNYYFYDAVMGSYNQWQQMYGDATASYVQMMGLDLTQPLDTQFFDEEAGTTWADYFFDMALEQAKNDMVLFKQADEAGFVTPQEDLDNTDASIEQMKAYLTLYGYTGFDEYLRSVYGNGASEKTFREYTGRSTRASAFYNATYNGLTYDQATINAKDAEAPKNYNGYSFASYYVSYNSFLEGGVEEEDGTITYTDEQKDAARASAKEVAEMLGQSQSVEALDAAIAALPINADRENAASSKNVNVLYPNISATMVDWITDESRQANDIHVFESAATSTDADGNEVKEINGYFISLFQGSSENLRPLTNVRHLLVSFEADDGTTNYTDEDKAEAYAKAEEILNQWKAGDATEESFIELVKEKSEDTGSAAEGGLFEDITPEQGVYVESFTNWSVDESRKAGDTGIIESPYGCHIMYYVGDSDITYREYMITNDLRNAEISEWYTNLVDNAAAEAGDLKHLSTDMVIAPAA